ncbi:hypothetical protein BsWGS_07494 [Bradybaena similaris]
MLFKHLLPKCSAFLGSQGKNYASLWRHTVRGYNGRTESSGSSDSEEYTVSDEMWDKQIHTCRRLPYKWHSPAHIYTDEAVSREYPPLNFFNYDKRDVEMGMANNGTLVTIDFPNKELQFSGAGLLHTFVVDHIHFHWGDDSSYGAEHQIDSQWFPMEMHIVHFNERYPNLATAEGNPKGIVVLAFLFEKSRIPNKELNHITDRLKEIKDPYSTVPLQLPSVMSILPGTVRESIFYQYANEPGTAQWTFAWVVFRDTIKISESQLAEFRSLNSSQIDEKTGLPKPLCNNNRTPYWIDKLLVFTNTPELEAAPAKPVKRGRSLRGSISNLFSRFKKK